ncbi:MAG: hypothetical protein F6K04_19415 [Leptolyngbya sp. SIO4C5]|nr:hypothetical protein [Leptolyngbya sp. SIO4C5]
MHSQLFVCILLTAPIEILAALMHQAIAAPLDLPPEQIKPLIDLAWQQFDQDQLEAAMTTFYQLLVVAEQYHHANGIEVALNGLQFTAKEISLRWLATYCASTA